MPREAGDYNFAIDAHRLLLECQRLGAENSELRQALKAQLIANARLASVSLSDMRRLEEISKNGVVGGGGGGDHGSR